MTPELRSAVISLPALVKDVRLCLCDFSISKYPTVDGIRYYSIKCGHSIETTSADRLLDWIESQENKENSSKTGG
jgi:hypothetical protein